MVTTNTTNKDRSAGGSEHIPFRRWTELVEAEKARQKQQKQNDGSKTGMGSRKK